MPFYIAAPTQTLDTDMANGSLIPIEERSPEELTHFEGRQVAAPGIHVRLPSTRQHMPQLACLHILVDCLP